jgi:hypothetical protein
VADTRGYKSVNLHLSPELHTTEVISIDVLSEPYWIKNEILWPLFFANIFFQFLAITFLFGKALCFHKGVCDRFTQKKDFDLREGGDVEIFSEPDSEPDEDEPR